VKRYAILERYGPQEAESAVNKIEAESEKDALAQYAINEGYADPRIEPEVEDPHTIAETYFYETRAGKTAMVFENTELIAVEVPS
jgi:hypothetical protein